MLALNAYKNISKELLALLSILIINRMGSTLLLFISIFLAESRGFSAATISVVMAFYGVGSALGSFFGGVLASSRGSARAQQVSLIVTGFGIGTIELLHSAWHLSLLVFIVGLFTQALKPANTLAILSLSTEDTRVRNLSLERQATNLGMAIAPVLAGALAKWGLVWAFRLDALTSLSAAILSLLLIKNVDAKTAHKVFEWRHLTFEVYFLIGLTLITGTIFFQFFTSFPVYATVRFGLSPSEFGLLMSINAGLILLTEVWLVHRLRHLPEAFLISCGLLLMSAGLASTQLFQNQPPLVASMIVFTLGEMLSIPFLTSWIVKSTTPNSRATVIGLYGSALAISMSFASLIGGKVIMFAGHIWLWNLLFLLSLIAAFVCVLFRRQKVLATAGD